MAAAKTKNLAGKRRKMTEGEAPYEVWYGNGWTYFVIKKNQANDDKPFAIWNVGYDGPLGSNLYGSDSYVSEVKQGTRLVWRDPLYAVALSEQGIETPPGVALAVDGWKQYVPPDPMSREARWANDLLYELDAHPQHQGIGWDLRAAKDRSIAKAIRQVVTLPDGTEAERFTSKVARYAVAVHVPNDEIEPAHWEVMRWEVRDKDLPGALARAGETYRETQTLEVRVEEESI